MTKFVVDNGKNLIQAYDAAETDALLNNKANSADVYSKTAADAKFYDKDAVDAIAGALNMVIGTKANANSVYTKSETLSLLSDKADKNGTYEELTAGHAGNLTSKVGEIDKTPYNFRTSGGSLDIGDLETDKIIGGSIAWNQLIKNGNFANSDIWGVNVIQSFSVSNNVATLNVSTTSSGIYQNSNFIVGHKYLWLVDVINGGKIQVGTAAFGSRLYINSANQTFKRYGRVDVATLDSAVFVVYANEDLEQTIQIKNYVCFDLTQMFGSTIADYIYSLESANAGAGVAWFKKLFPKSYYAYNAGEIMSVMTSAHKMIGFNAWDGENESGYIYNGNYYPSASYWRTKNFIPVVPNTAYYFNVPSTDGQINCFDYDKNYIGKFDGMNARLATMPSNCYYIKFYQPASADVESVCVNISWDGERNGEYEPYVVHNYPLQANLELRGIPKLDASNNLYYDGDEYESSGKVTRKYGIVDLGSLTWTNNGTIEGGVQYFTESVNKAHGTDNILCALFVTKFPSIEVGTCQGRANSNAISVNSSITDLNAFKTAMSGVYLVYELAETVEESASSYDNPQIVNDFGTEQYVDGREVEIPVGHDTFYQANLKAKLEMSPDSPDNNGSYLMQHNNGENSYIPYISPIPTPPTTDGTYILKAVVSSGVATLQWIEETT